MPRKFTQRSIRFFAILFCWWAVVGAYAQGTVNFVNHNTNVYPVIDARIHYSAGGPMPVGWVDSQITFVDPATQIVYGGLSAQVGLYGGPAGSKEKDLKLLVPAVGFGTGVNAGYLWTGVDSVRTLIGLQPGQGAVFQLRGWDAGFAPGETVPPASYEAADALTATRGVYLGKSRLVTVSALGALGDPTRPPAELIGLSGFDLAWAPVPEPTVLVLGIVGLICLVGLTRKR